MWGPHSHSSFQPFSLSPASLFPHTLSSAAFLSIAPLFRRQSLDSLTLFCPPPSLFRRLPHRLRPTVSSGKQITKDERRFDVVGLTLICVLIWVDVRESREGSRQSRRGMVAAAKRGTSETRERRGWMEEREEFRENDM